MNKLLDDNDLGLSMTNKTDKFFLGLVKKVASVDKINELYAAADGRGVEFAENCLKKLNIEVICSDLSLDNIPSQGAFILVCNLPHGMLDGLLLFDTVIRKRADTKLIGNFPVSQVDKIKDNVICIDAFTSRQGSRFAGLRQAKEHLQQGHPLIIFPSGRVASAKISLTKFNENQWSATTIKFISHANVPIIPAHIDGRNTLKFQALSFISADLQLLLMGRELFSKEGRSYNIEIGGAISERDKSRLLSLDQLQSYLRANILLMRHRIKIFGRKQEKTEYSIVKSEKNLLAELSMSKFASKVSSEDLVLSDTNFNSYVVKTTLLDASVVASIFGAKNSVAEHCIICFDKQSSQAMCVQQLRYADKSMLESGVEGLYTNNFFEYSHKYSDVLRQSIEIGQRYIAPHFRASRGLDEAQNVSILLWKSAIALLERQEQYRYLIGTTSIGTEYSTLAKQIISKYIRLHLFNKRFDRMVVARQAAGRFGKDLFERGAIENITELYLANKLIADSDPTQKSMPKTLEYLIKKEANVLALSTNHKDKDKLNVLMLIDLNAHNESELTIVPRETNVL